MTPSIQITLMILLSILAIFIGCAGLYCLKRHHDIKEDNGYGFAAWVILIVFITMVGGIAKVAGVDIGL